jgi:WD40 repeat protein
VYRVTDRQLLLLHTFLAKDDGRGWSCWTGCQLLFVSATRAIAKSNSKGTFKVWDVETCEELGCLACETRWYPPVMCCDVFANDTRAIAGRIDGQLAVWDLNNGVFREDFVLRSHSAAVTCCAAFEGGTKAISGGKDSVLKVWDLVYRVELVTLRGHKDVVWCCSVLPTGERAVSGSFDRTVKVWDTGTGWLQHTISQHTHFVWCCALAASGSILVSGSCDGTLQYRPLPTDDGESSPKPRVSVGESAPPSEGSFRHARVTLDSSVS